jgi:hypothetical protein
VRTVKRFLVLAAAIVGLLAIATALWLKNTIEGLE